MKFSTCLAMLLCASTSVYGADESKKVVVDRSQFSEVYPAVWFSPSTGEIAPLKERSEIPPQKKFEIWIEPDDPEFGYNPDLKPKGVGFVKIGKGLKFFREPTLPKNPKLNLKITKLMKQAQGVDNLVFFCQAKNCTCLIMITSMNSKEEVISFSWRLLK